MTHVKRFLAAIFTLFITLLIVGCDDRGDVINKAWRETLGISKQDGPYRWFPYPVDNFGVCTFYDPPSNRNYIDSDRICATWSCLGLDPATLSDDERMSVSGYADIGGGGLVAMTDEQSRELAGKLSIPLLSKLAEVGFSAEYSKQIEITLTIQKAYKRSVNREKLRLAVEASKNKTLIDAFNRGGLVYIAADIVATGVTLSLTSNKSVATDVNAKLGEALDVISKDASLGFELMNKSETSGTLTIPHPVILGVQARKQPQNLVLAAEPISRRQPDNRRVPVSVNTDDEIVNVALPRPPLVKN